MIPEEEIMMRQLEQILDCGLGIPGKLRIVDRRNKDREFEFDSLEELFAKLEAEDKDDIPFCDEDCERCPGPECDHYDECTDSYDEDEDEEEPIMWGIPEIRRIIFNAPATIVFWEDGTKTVVKCMAGEKFERYAGFAMACMKKMFGSTANAKTVMEELSDENIRLDPCEPVKPNAKAPEPKEKQVEPKEDPVKSKEDEEREAVEADLERMGLLGLVEFFAKVVAGAVLADRMKEKEDDDKASEP